MKNKWWFIIKIEQIITFTAIPVDLQVNKARLQTCKTIHGDTALKKQFVIILISNMELKKHITIPLTDVRELKYHFGIIPTHMAELFPKVATR